MDDELFEDDESLDFIVYDELEKQENTIALSWLMFPRLHKSNVVVARPRFLL